MLLRTGHTDVLTMTSQYCDSGFRPEGVKEEGLSVLRLCDTEVRLPLLRPTLDNPALLHHNHCQGYKHHLKLRKISLHYTWCQSNKVSLLLLSFI